MWFIDLLAVLGGAVVLLTAFGLLIAWGLSSPDAER